MTIKVTKSQITSNLWLYPCWSWWCDRENSINFGGCKPQTYC